MKKIFIILSILSFAYAQNSEKLFSQESSNFNNNQLQLMEMWILQVLKI